MGSPTMDGAGVIAVGTLPPGAPAVYLVSASNGSMLSKLTSADAFAQPVFAEDEIFTATSAGVSAWGLPG